MSERTEVFQWDGEDMVPVSPGRAGRAFVVGEKYRMTVEEFRSWRSHKHEFAWLKDAWANLPERYAMEPWAQSPEHLRKYALIRCGYCNTQTFPCASKTEAMRWASNMRAMDEYSICQAQGDVVHRFMAKSQSVKSMGAREFQESKTAIMEFIAGLLGVESRALRGAA